MNVDILLDVDGCVLATCDKDNGGMAGKATGWNDWRSYARADGYQAYSPEMLNRLTALAALPGVTMHWCTSWRERADTVLAPEVGLPRGWAVVHRERAPEHLDARPGNAVVWIDDDLMVDRSTRDWFHDNGDRALGVEPDHWCGITRAQIEDIETWVGKQRDSAIEPS